MTPGLFKKVRRAPESPTRWDNAVAALAGHRPVVAIHHHGASLLRTGETITTLEMAELVRLTTGFVQVALPLDRCDELLLGEAIPTERGRRPMTCGQSVSVDAAVGIGTGISAADRARTTRVLSDPSSQPSDLSRPGHVIPIRVTHSQDCSFSAMVMRLVHEAGSAAAVFAELVPITDPTRTVGRDEAMAIAAELRTTAVCLDV